MKNIGDLLFRTNILHQSNLFIEKTNDKNKKDTNIILRNINW